MAYALVTHVNLEGRSPEEAEKLLHEEVIPIVKGLPGFDRGVWLRSADVSTGMAVVVFDSEENAKAAQEGMNTMRPSDAPPITSSDIYIVAGEA